MAAHVGRRHYDEVTAPRMLACVEASEDALFAQADEALAMMAVEEQAWNGDEEIDSDDEDEWGVSVLCRKLSDARARTVVLPDGDVHVCDHDCPYTEEDAKEGNCVCRFTGLIVARLCSERRDQSTGRSTWSSDPDMQSGKPIGGWGKKRDMMAASRHAYDLARVLNDSDMPVAAAAPPRSPSRAAVGAACGRAGGGGGSKRGALCVDEAPPVDAAPKRQRASKRDVEALEMRATLMAEAERTLLDLLGKRTGTSANAKHGPQLDPRLLNKELLFGAALKKYLKDTMAVGRTPNMDDVSNIALAVGRVIAEEQEKRTRQAGPPAMRVFEPRFREASARLAVSLWQASCQTPYLRQAKRGTDSFKPFCAGVFYAFKRGLTLSNGTVLVPRIDDFTNALPEPKKIASDAAMKSLHASSHRGLCTLHKCIGSVDAGSSHELFVDVIRCARQVR